MKKIIALNINNSRIKVKVRPVKKGDVEAIWLNFNEVINEGDYLPTFLPVESKYEMNAWYEDLKKQNELCIVAELVDHAVLKTRSIIGQCEITNVEWEAAAHVGNLGIIVKKEFRNKGIGYHLIDAAIREAKKNHGKEKIILSCFHTNKRAIHLYEKMGFKRVGVRKGQFYMNSRYYDEILMELWIKDYLNSRDI